MVVVLSIFGRDKSGDPTPDIGHSSLADRQCLKILLSHYSNGVTNG